MSSETCLGCLFSLDLFCLWWWFCFGVEALRKQLGNARLFCCCFFFKLFHSLEYFRICLAPLSIMFHYNTCLLGVEISTLISTLPLSQFGPKILVPYLMLLQQSSSSKLHRLTAWSQYQAMEGGKKEKTGECLYALQVQNIFFQQVAHLASQNPEFSIHIRKY